MNPKIIFIISAPNFIMASAHNRLRGGDKQNKYTMKLQNEKGFDFGTDSVEQVGSLFEPVAESKSPSNGLSKKSFFGPRYSFSGSRDSYNTTGQTSSNSTPRSSFMGKIKSIFRPSDESLRREPSDGSFDMRAPSDESLEMRPASSSLDFGDFSYMISFPNVDGIEWDELPEPSKIQLSEEEDEIIDKYIYRISEDGLDFQDFKIAVHKTLEYIVDTYNINGLVVSLASELVYSYDNKAPKALKLFMDRKLPFMTKRWNHSKLNYRINSKLIEDHSYYQKFASNTKFQHYLSTLFLDLGAKEGFFDALINLYMEAFDNITTSEQFIDRYTKILSALIEVAYKNKPKTSTADDEFTFPDIYYALRDDMSEFTEKALQKIKGR